MCIFIFGWKSSQIHRIGNHIHDWYLFWFVPKQKVKIGNPSIRIFSLVFRT